MDEYSYEQGYSFSWDHRLLLIDVPQQSKKNKKTFRSLDCDDFWKYVQRKRRVSKAKKRLL
jgi:hypothetical protein